MSAAPGGLTILRCVEKYSASKTWRWNDDLQKWVKIKDYDAGSWFTATEYAPRDLRGLVAVLDQVRRDPQAFIVRGELAPETKELLSKYQNYHIRRRKLARPNQPATLLEVDRQWLPLDIDGWPLRQCDDLADSPELTIEHAICELLPKPFHDVECAWQLSSSAGFKPGFLKVHLYYWLNEPASNATLKAVLRQCAPGVDVAPFSAAQPLYVADPRIEGAADPLPRRVGWLRGVEESVVLPRLEPNKPRAKATWASTSRSIGDGAETLDKLGDGENGQGFHAVLRAETMRYARRCARGSVVRDDAELIARLLGAIESAPRRSDRGDPLTTYGETYLQRIIDGAFSRVSADPEGQAIKPHHVVGSAQTLEDARAALKQHICGFFERALKFHAARAAEETSTELPEHAGLIVGVGAGKSTAARAALPGFIASAKAAGLANRVLWLVPTLRLADECLTEMHRLGINAAVMRGRAAEDPNAAPSQDGKPQQMCKDLEAVDDALEALASVETSVCGSAKPDYPRCPWRLGAEQCAFQRQKGQIQKADVVIAAHTTMFFELSKDVRNGLASVVIDESWWQQGLSINRQVPVDGFAHEVVARPVLQREHVNGKKTSFRQLPDNSATADLHTISAKAEKAFAATEEGELVAKASVTNAGLTADECRRAYLLEWRRLVEGVPYPGQPAKERKKAMQRAAGNKTIARRAGVWRALEALLEGQQTHTGRLQVTTRNTKAGPVRMIALHTRRDIREEITGLPILCLDATMPLPIVRYYLPRLELLAEINPVAPHMTLTQVAGNWGKTSLVPSPKSTPEVASWRQKLISELADFVLLHSGGGALVVTYKAIEKEFNTLPGVRAAHFNAIAGLDTFRDVAALFVIGRPLPDPVELRLIGLALTGRAIPEEAGQVETRGALMVDGRGSATRVRTYADPDLEALRVAITDAEVIQAIGRGRGVNRSAADRLNVWLLADVVLPLPVSRMVRWVDVRPDVLSRMAARGVVLLGASDAARSYPDLFPTPDAARMALKRMATDFPNIPLCTISHKEMFGKSLVRVSYRPAGRGQQNRQALVARERLAALAEWLTAQLGAPVTVSPAAPEAQTDVTPASGPKPTGIIKLGDQAPFDLPAKKEPAPMPPATPSPLPPKPHLWGRGGAEHRQAVGAEGLEGMSTHSPAPDCNTSAPPAAGMDHIRPAFGSIRCVHSSPRLTRACSSETAGTLEKLSHTNRF